MTMEQIKDIATIVKARSKAKDLKGTVKEVLGAWYFFVVWFLNSQSVGGLVDGKPPKEICKMIEKGEIDVKEP